MKCPNCGAENAQGMSRCGNCDGPLPTENPNGKGAEDSRGAVEERWNRLMSTREPSISADTVVLNTGSPNRDLKLASTVLIVALIVLVVGFILQIYSNEKVEGLYSGDLSEMMEIFEDLEEISKAAKWAGYLQTLGLILIAAGLVGMTKGLSDRL